MLSTLFLKGHNPFWHDAALLVYHLADVAQDPDALGNVWNLHLRGNLFMEMGNFTI